MKILLVDRDQALRAQIARLLDEQGDEIIQVEDGQQAWRIFQQQDISLAITDWDLSGVDGPTLIRRIRETFGEPYTYLIMLTAHKDPQDIVAGLQAGADDYLIKPFHSDELLARVLVGKRILSMERALQDKQAKLAQLAYHDELTGLMNRKAIIDRAKGALNYAQRNAQPVSFVMADLDHFKAINDQHGHLVGDQALRQVGTLLSNSVRSYDEVGRWGGEEFLFVLQGTTLDEALEVTKRIQSILDRKPLRLDDGTLVPLTASFGVTTCDPSTSSSPDVEELLQQADSAMYQAKQRGRNQVQIFKAAS
ncbi:MAG: diguanylate cyclase [Chloroflexota bacterium]|nr:diguanylate cyclase [Chloroflexota bacterium]